MDWVKAGWEAAQAGFLCMDTQGIITQANPTLVELFSTPGEQVLGHQLYEFVDPYSRQKAETMLALTLAEGSVEDWELDVTSPGAIPILIGFTTSCIRDEAGKVTGIMAVCRDLTEKTRLTAELAKVNQDLEGALLKLEKAHQDLKNAQAQLIHAEKMRSLGQMVAGIAHEINNPIGFVSNNLTFLMEKTEQLRNCCDKLRQTEIEIEILPDQFWGDIHDAIEESMDGAERVANIVKALRNFSRLDESEFKQANLVEGLKSTLQIIKATYQQKVVFTEEYASVREIFCNPGTLNQVFMNLIVNAADAIESQGRVIIRAFEEADQIVVQVEDNGIGMKKETLSHLGEPFFTTKPVGSGTGLGLAISYGIIQNHQGTIQFTSEPGQGTLAEVRIPMNLNNESL